MMDEFDDGLDPAATGARQSPVVPDGGAEQQIPQLVSEVYARAPAPLRAELLECLLRPVGPHLFAGAVGTG